MNVICKCGWPMIGRVCTNSDCKSNQPKKKQPKKGK